MFIKFLKDVVHNTQAEGKSARLKGQQAKATLTNCNQISQRLN